MCFWGDATLDAVWNAKFVSSILSFALLVTAAETFYNWKSGPKSVLNIFITAIDEKIDAFCKISEDVEK